MTTASQTAHIAAVVLNNVGVSLLERCRYREAFEAFSDATTLIMRIAHSSNYEMVGVTNRLDQANRTLACCQNRCCQKRINVITQEEISVAIRRSFDVSGEVSGILSSIPSLIRIEYVDTSLIEDPMSHSLEEQSSIILYNLGNAYMCMASEEKSLIQAKKNWEKALNLFRLSHSIIVVSAREPSDELTSLPFAILVLQNLVRIVSALGLSTDAQRYFSEMLELKSYFEHVDTLSQFFFTDAPAAAAA